jgi:hypothetical protein
VPSVRPEPVKSLQSPGLYACGATAREPRPATEPVLLARRTAEWWLVMVLMSLRPTIPVTDAAEFAGSAGAAVFM